MMRLLYRGLLRLYPASYQQQFADEMADVFLRVQADLAQGSYFLRARFYARELSGLISGAGQAHFRSIFGHEVSFRRWNMRSGFRFPRSTVFMMLVILAGVLLAIEKAKTIQVKYGPQEVMAVWNSLPWFLLLFPVVACAAVAAIWVLLFALRRTGMHRLSGIHTWF